MKVSTIVLILFFIATFIPFKIPDEVVAFEFDRLANEGYVAHIVNESNWDSPIPDDEEANGPHEDPAKCVCRGTGKITHGDGHQTPCPFHDGSSTPDDEDDRDIDRQTKCKCDTSTTYCNCINAYGRCDCEQFPASSGDTKPTGKEPVTPEDIKKKEQAPLLEKNSNAIHPESHMENVGASSENAGGEQASDSQFKRLDNRAARPVQQVVTVRPDAFNGMGTPSAAEFTKEEQMILFTATWCAPCTEWKSVEQPVLVDHGWKISADKNIAHIRLVDVDENPELFMRYGQGKVPSFHMFVKGREQGYRIGYSTAKEVTDLFYLVGK